MSSAGEAVRKKEGFEFLKSTKKILEKEKHKQIRLQSVVFSKINQYKPFIM